MCSEAEADIYTYMYIRYVFVCVRGVEAWIPVLR